MKNIIYKIRQYYSKSNNWDMGTLITLNKDKFR